MGTEVRKGKHTVSENILCGSVSSLLERPISLALIPQCSHSYKF